MIAALFVTVGLPALAVGLLILTDPRKQNTHQRKG